MFITWLNTHDLAAVGFADRIYPPAADRAYWDAFDGAPYVAAAEAKLGCDWPIIRATAYMAFSRSGDRQIMQHPHFTRRRALNILAVGEIVEHRGRFLPDLIDGIFAICEESYWGVSAHWYRAVGNIPTPTEPYIDLFAAETAASLAFIYSILGEELRAECPELLDRIADEIERRILTPYLAHTDYWWMGYTKKPNNWNPWILSNLIPCCLTFAHDPDRRRTALGKIMTELQHYVDGMPDDGGCDEGPAYWGAAGAALFECIYQLKVASGGAIDLMHDAKARRIMDYVAFAYIGEGRFINFADAAVAGPGRIGELTCLIGREMGLPRLVSLSRALYTPSSTVTADTSKLRRMLIALTMSRSMTDLPPFSPTDAECLPDLEVATLRRGDFYLAAKGGHNNESHNHNDVGSFVLYDACRPLLIDVGVGTYTRQTFSAERYSIWTMQSGYHNLPAVGGVDQRDGANYRASAFALRGDTVSISFADAYPAGSTLTAADRALTLTADGLTLRDYFAYTAEAQTVTEHLMTCRKPTVIDGRVTLEGGYTLTAPGCAITVDAIDLADNAALRSNWQQDTLWRINFTKPEATEITVRLERSPT